MINSILDKVIEYKNKSVLELRLFFDSINITCFNDILMSNESDEDKKSIIYFILYAYSEDSKWVILKADGELEKKNICEKLNIPEYLVEKLIHLVDSKIRVAVVGYLEHFAGIQFKTLQSLKIQYNDMQRKLTMMDFKIIKRVKVGKGEPEEETEEFDKDTWLKVMQLLPRVATQINKLETEIYERGKYPNLVKEVLKDHKKSKSSTFGSIETSQVLETLNNKV